MLFYKAYNNGKFFTFVEEFFKVILLVFVEIFIFHFLISYKAVYDYCSQNMHDFESNYQVVNNINLFAINLFKNFPS
jgi:hypothetical protein